ncbi:hypothetical protein DPMN_064983 [Dreissena polymorpha]|uniref:Uncharacterized protein n=1 Tax=Dreissena polymorpha TaxID=45954 RepID=A0A9D4CE56_DREPO|nr:hypothetical protein DPMN_064983 [Dreissena polymorpha]
MSAQSQLVTFVHTGQHINLGTAGGSYEGRRGASLSTVTQKPTRRISTCVICRNTSPLGWASIHWEGSRTSHEILGISSRDVGEDTCAGDSLPWNGWGLQDRSVSLAPPCPEEVCADASSDTSALFHWQQRFPQTYFGFTNKIAALQNVKDSRLLLETDAPYFSALGSRVSSPSQISTVAETVAALRGTTVEHVMEISVANGKHLYQSQ